VLPGDTLYAMETIFFFAELQDSVTIRVQQQHVSGSRESGETEIERRQTLRGESPWQIRDARYLCEGAAPRVFRAYELDAALSFARHNERCKLAANVIWEKMRFAAST